MTITCARTHTAVLYSYACVHNVHDPIDTPGADRMCNEEKKHKYKSISPKKKKTFSDNRSCVQQFPMGALPSRMWNVVVRKQHVVCVACSHN